MRTLEKTTNEQEEIDDCVEDTVEAIIAGRYSLQCLKRFSRDVNEKNRVIAHQEDCGALDEASLRFMHQVVKGALGRVGSQKKLNYERVRRHIRPGNSIVE